MYHMRRPETAEERKREFNNPRKYESERDREEREEDERIEDLSKLNHKTPQEAHEGALISKLLRQIVDTSPDSWPEELKKEPIHSAALKYKASWQKAGALSEQYNKLGREHGNPELIEQILQKFNSANQVNNHDQKSLESHLAKQFKAGSADKINENHPLKHYST